MHSSSTHTKNDMLTSRAEAWERRRRENAKKAEEAAGRLFPGENWMTVEDGIYLSPNRKTGKGSNHEEELNDAKILRDLGHTVYLVPEPRKTLGKKYDAIVNGDKMEFKNVGGNANTLITHFLKSRSQAPNVFINLERSHLTRREIMAALYGARNSQSHPDKKGNIIKGYAGYNAFSGGRIILKIRGNSRLVYLNVDALKAKRRGC